MKYLGIDFGLSKVGLAVSDGKLAEPLRVIRYTDIKVLVGNLKSLIFNLRITDIVIGMPEGGISDEVNVLASLLLLETGLKPKFQDETLSTLEAQIKSKEAGMKQKKRKAMEDAFAATNILQSYLDS